MAAEIETMTEKSVNAQLKDCVLSTRQMLDMMQLAGVLRPVAKGMPTYTNVQLHGRSSTWSFASVRGAFAFYLRTQPQ